MNRKRLAIIFSLVFLFAVVGPTITSSNQGIPPQDRDQLDEEATPVQIGVMTGKQKQHSKLYNSYEGNGDLEEILNHTPGNEIKIISMPGIAELSPTGKPDASALDSMVENADLIAIGVVSEKNSQLNEKRTFIFTDYDFNVAEILKNIPNVEIEPNASITVTSPGGKIFLNGKTVTAIDRTFKPLRKGKKYLLFLKLITATGAYQALDYKSSFEINDQVTILTDGPVPAELQSGKRPDAFLNQVRLSITAYLNKPEKST